MDGLREFLYAQLDEKERPFLGKRRPKSWAGKSVILEIQAERRLLAGLAVIRAGGSEWITPCEADETLRLLAFPYRGRPGYRPEWFPVTR